MSTKVFANQARSASCALYGVDSGKIKRYSFSMIVMLLATAQWLIASVTTAQSLDSVMINISVKNETLLNTFHKIEKQTPFRFMYREKQITHIRNINLSESHIPLSRLLDVLLTPNGLSYSAVDKRILIAPDTQKTIKQDTQENSTAEKTISENANIIVKGTVVDAESRLPIRGVNIIVKGTTQGTKTDDDGNFSVSVAGSSSVLIFSYVGYESQEVRVGENSTLNILLKVEVKSLSDVLVIGYGTVKRSDLTGSVSSVKGSDLAKAAPVDVLSGLQGRAAGVRITASEGAPGAGMNILIRGTNSLGSSSPLIVVDGIPGIPTTSLNANDIESIEILKDASSTAIYGSRGANGVIMITTKRGKKGREQVDYIGNASFNEVIKKIDVLDAYTYALLRNEGQATANKLSGTSDPLPFDGELHYNSTTNSYYRAPKPEEFIGQGTDWQDILFRRSMTQNHTLTVSGGTDAGTHLLSVNYLNQEGVIIGSKYEKIAFRTNLNRNINKWLTVGNNLLFSTDKNSMVKTNNTNENVFASGVTRSALTYPPTISIIDTLTKTNSFVPNLINPYVYTTQLFTQNRQTYFNAYTYLEAQIVKGLKFRQNVGFMIAHGNNDEYIPIVISLAERGRAEVNTSINKGLLSESILSYSQTFGKHTVGATAGAVVENWIYESRLNRVNNFSSDLFLTNNFGAATGIPFVQNGKSQSSLASMLGRLNYNFDGRYLATISFRGDGSSKFSKKNKWAYFPSAAFAWVISSEKFLRDKEFISELKLRTSYGETGNQAISSYQTQNKLIPALYPINGNLVSGFADNQGAGPGNDDLKWETVKQFDVGIDASFFNGRLGFTVDYYYKRTTDLLQSIVIPGSTGFLTKVVNSGEIENKGLEVLVNGGPVRTPNFSWDVSANISFNRNKILKLADGVTEQFARALDHRANNVPFIQRIGYAVGTLYGRVENGIFRNEAEVRALPQYANLPDAAVQALIGEISYADLNGDGFVDDNDRQIIGDVNPRYFFGFNNDLRYKQFDLNIFINGVIGGDIINMNNQFINDIGGFLNTTRDVYNNRWTPENWENATYPKAWLTYTRNIYTTSRYFESGTYIRLRNIVLGYTANVRNSPISKLRVYISGINLLTISKYKGFDPDVNAFGGAARSGVDFASYPTSKTVNLGVQLSF